MKTTLDYAQELYSQGKLKEALDAALSIGAVEDSATNMAVSLLITKLQLLLLVDLQKEDSKESFRNMLNTTCRLASSIEDLWLIEREIRETITAWAIEDYRTYLEVLKAEPTEEVVKVIFGLPFEYSKFALVATIAPRFGPIVDDFVQKNNLDGKSAYATYLEKNLGFPAAHLPDDKKTIMDIEASAYILNDVKRKCTEISNTSEEYINHNKKALVNALCVIDALIHMSCSDTEEITRDLSLDALKLRAQILSFMLNGKVYLNGKTIYLLSGNREYFINNLKVTYEAIAKVDLSFSVPTLPPAQVGTNQKTGGCYVATAVYGSYDCPEVWTLRRFRDDILSDTWYGRVFIRTYYAISPTLVKWFGNAKWFKNIWKPTLDRMVKKLNASGVNDMPYNDRIW